MRVGYARPVFFSLRDFEMKKIFALLVALVFSVGAIYARDKVTSDVNVLPLPARTLLAKHFPKIAVNHIKIDSDVFSKDYDVVLQNGTEVSSKDYDVVLQNGTEVSFDKDGNLKEVEAGVNTVPDGLVLKPIRQYVKSNFKGRRIVALDVDRNSYDIELSDGLELKFDRAGNFLRIDD